MTLGFRLREVVQSDATVLWGLANDAETRAASFSRGLIPWEEHVAWIERNLASAAVHMLIAEAPSGEPVGSIRFDTADRWATARLSYVIAPAYRGRGLARDLLSAGRDWIWQRHPTATLIAEVMEQNVRSLQALRRNGWHDVYVRDGVARLARSPKLES